MSITSHCLINEELYFTPYDSKWIPFSSRLCTVGATSHGAGKIVIHSLEEKHLKLTQEAETNTPVRCGTITGQARNFATGDFEGQLQIWDTQRFDIPLVTFKAHESIINSIDSLNQADKPQELVTGSRDGCVKVWDMRQPEKAVLTVKSKDDSKDIWSVAYGQLKGHSVIVVGYEDGDIKLFNVDNAQYLWETNVKDGVCSIDFNNSDLKVSTLAGAFIIDLESGKLKEIKCSTDTTLWSIRHIPQQPDYFAVAGGDGNLSTYNQKSLSKPINVLDLSKHPIISLDWNKDKRGLFACSSFDQSIKVGIIQNI